LNGLFGLGMFLLGGGRLTMIIDRESSSADPPQQLRERKKELILEPKDWGGGAVMSYMERMYVWLDEFVCGSLLVDRDGGRVLLSSLAWCRVGLLESVLSQTTSMGALVCSPRIAWRTRQLRRYARLTDTNRSKPVQASDKQVTSKQAMRASKLQMSFIK
jgi:hypothetical protein